MMVIHPSLNEERRKARAWKKAAKQHRMRLSRSPPLKILVNPYGRARRTVRTAGELKEKKTGENGGQALAAFFLISYSQKGNDPKRRSYEEEMQQPRGGERCGTSTAISRGKTEQSPGG